MSENRQKEKYVLVKDVKKLGKLLTLLEEFGFEYGFDDFFGKTEVTIRGEPIYFYRNRIIIGNGISELCIKRCGKDVVMVLLRKEGENETKKVVYLPRYIDFYYYYPDRKLGLILFDETDG
jgi:hypothetical protein